MELLFDFSAVPLLVLGAVFAASILQSITGIGFGVIAGPALLISMGSAVAIQVSIVLSFLIALILAPNTLPRVDRNLLKDLFRGVVIGTPLGALALASLSIGALKLVAIVVVGCMTLIATGLLSRYPVFERDGKGRRLVVGGVSGILNTALAMPGPALAAYATAIRSTPEIVRSTTLVTFLLAYPVALVVQAGVVGLSAELWLAAAPLVLPTVAGTLIGIGAARFVNPLLFRLLTIGFLLASTIALALG
ncbi:sulfite exporter TauE/SafE family protein [Chelatococcus asaccharovorans]|uniref:Probable membrane transporter protein n=1 Tax=Chelatococcus asaccharovorans TaxID=28210 RepID=A0A2V3UJQ7_9HYPH|nr:sulfite exporter TauE/SafE family protein [Chelatococcus asaccharovorans]MBS7701760.1 sulfite exporter TauE/SafE family protein [Chelatococcus asaccharovorans]PXW64534.1 sulfite exporter TauE/SafE [Chelatococcus asaccharovorans]CAH1665285.1 putative membrane transporter protein [Chelatococcus asaccharovorans]CAH1682025.1 putative membrane transporter protein [Chelatococcus asaccharovorans]